MFYEKWLTYQFAFTFPNFKPLYRKELSKLIMLCILEK